MKPFTRQFQERYFPHHSQGLARLNHGSFGSCPEPVGVEQDRWRHLWLQQPDDFYYNHLEEELARVRSDVAKGVNCKDVEELVMVDNATTAAVMIAQAVAESITTGRWGAGDAVLIPTFAYGAVRKVFEHHVVRAGGTILDVALPFPVEDEAPVLAAFEAAVQRAAARQPPTRIRLAVVDHVSSMPSYVMPVAKIVALLRRSGVDEVFVDAAHAHGNVAVDLEAIGADYYTSNLHKWAFAPVAAAFFHCRREHLGRLHHPIASWLFGEGLARECSWVGTRDFSPMLAAPAGLRFMDDVCGGEEGLRAANSERVLDMAAMLARAWADLMWGHDREQDPWEAGSEQQDGARKQNLGLPAPSSAPDRESLRLATANPCGNGLRGGPRVGAGAGLGAPAAMCSAMAMVALPPAVGVHSDADALALRRRLRDEFCVEVPIYYCSGGEVPLDDSKASSQRAIQGGQPSDLRAVADGSPRTEPRVTAYARLSHQVYNTEGDFLMLRDAVRAICQGQPSTGADWRDEQTVAGDVEKGVE